MNGCWLSPVIYIYREIISYSHGVVTPMCISLDLGRIWTDKVYIDGVYHHTRPTRVLCMYDKFVCIFRVYGYTYFICYYHSII